MHGFSHIRFLRMFTKECKRMSRNILPGYEDMILDEERNQLYHDALQEALTAKPDAIVLDIGTGSGVHLEFSEF